MNLCESQRVMFVQFESPAGPVGGFRLVSPEIHGLAGAVSDRAGQGQPEVKATAVEIHLLSEALGCLFGACRAGSSASSWAETVRSLWFPLEN